MNVDLCFVMDCTGSMAKHIQGAKDCILKVVEHMENMNPKIKIWVGFCGYRDHCDSDRLQTLDFTTMYNDFKSYLYNNVPATGGGDTPEDVLGGLHEAITKMTWKNSIRIILHVCDAPPHGLRFTNLSDTYPGGDPLGLTAESVLQEMKDKNISYFFGKITNDTEGMIRVFREIIGHFEVFDLKNEESVLQEMKDKNISYFFGKITNDTEGMIRVFREIIGHFEVFDLKNEGKPDRLVSKFFDATRSAILTAVTLRE
ncbi:hypothetical protein Glove_243g66 [Diversispora epigaea]|uniref:VWFA domain-containing protein n=1 Tax=Diversispora epigaea TaxID=1348612 RepID=A0A397I929_9GLOM|nr:hypothetical protein Glove_243g66 [Diversispora epigaea]